MWARLSRAKVQRGHGVYQANHDTRLCFAHLVLLTVTHATRFKISAKNQRGILKQNHWFKIFNLISSTKHVLRRLVPLKKKMSRDNYSTECSRLYTENFCFSSVQPFFGVKCCTRKFGTCSSIQNNFWSSGFVKHRFHFVCSLWDRCCCCCCCWISIPGSDLTAVEMEKLVDRGRAWGGNVTLRRLLV